VTREGPDAYASTTPAIAVAKQRTISNGPIAGRLPLIVLNREMAGSHDFINLVRPERRNEMERTERMLQSRRAEATGRSRQAGAGEQASKTSLFGSDLYCLREPFGLDLYCRRPPFGGDFYSDINSSVIYP
jgi:hypothetical protein